MRYRFGECELDTARRELRRAGQPVALEPKPFAVLVYLLEHRERVVSKDELLAQCWPETFVSEAALTQCLAKVRRAVQPAGSAAPVIDTVYGQGYRFTAAVETAPPPPLPAAADDPKAAARRSRILIVDDEPFAVDYLTQVLEELGYETIRAANGQEALDQVASRVPDLILLDIMMPVLDGFSVCRILKGHDETRLIPIIIMTALDAVEDRVEGIKAGADDFLTKPVHEEELLARIETALKLKHTVDRKLGELHRLKARFAQLVRLLTAPESPSPSAADLC
ncbi:MAG: hypothetical protein KatS3mg131_2795 [Candidatus Tectimicrobiota bacterium]|nr:MAG: hypothetical protein KatS3mg131_2795 [Candidatus Tectomicrobia bacterium]